MFSKFPEFVELKNKNVFVGVSGGVDSAVSAAILQANGANVTGVFLKNWAGEEGLQLDCPWQEDQDAAQAVCEHLKIPFRSYNFEVEYKAEVLDYFFKEYQSGRTPNPDILCNSKIKFRAFLDKAKKDGADFIATGHYATQADFLISENKTVRLLHKPSDHNKDQTYFLSDLDQEQLKSAIFPLADLTKPEVREIAAELKLPNYARPDSQGICFIGDLDVQKFLHKYIAATPGEIRDIDTGKKLGEHTGLAFYTIGQREGLQIGGSPLPYYVAGKDATTNTLFVALGKDNPALFQQEVSLEPIHWLAPELERYVSEKGTDLKLEAALRYRQIPQPGFLDLSESIFKFEQPQRAVTPGQSLVIFAGNFCLGRAIIK